MEKKFKTDVPVVYKKYGLNEFKEKNFLVTGLPFWTPVGILSNGLFLPFKVGNVSWDDVAHFCSAQGSVMPTAEELFEAFPAEVLDEFDKCCEALSLPKSQDTPVPIGKVPDEFAPMRKWGTAEAPFYHLRMSAPSLRTSVKEVEASINHIGIGYRNVGKTPLRVVCRIGN